MDEALSGPSQPDSFEPEEPAAPAAAAPEPPPPLSHDAFALAWCEGPGRDFAFTGASPSTARHWTGEGGITRWTSGAPAVAAAVHSMRTTMRDAVPDRDKPAWLRKPHITGALALAAMSPGMVAPPETWDRDPLIAGLPDGWIVELRTGKRRHARREDHVSLALGAVPDRQGEWERFRAYLRGVTGGDRALGRALRAIMGAGLIGRADRAFPLLVGPTGTGKTVYGETGLTVAGDYGAAMRGETLLAGRGEHPTAIAMLEGKRLVTASEFRGGVWRSDLVKRLTGGDTLSAHRMRQDERSFSPTHTLLALANPQDLPQSGTLDDAMSARVRVVPFAHKPDRETPHLAALIAESELPRVTAWALAGAADVLANGFLPILDACQRVRDATEDWRASGDALSDWLDDCCKLDPDAFERRAELYASYRRHAGKYAANKRAFFADMDARFGQISIKDGYRIYRGLALLDGFHD